MNPVSGAAPVAAVAGNSAAIRKASQEFEALLLQQLLGPLQATFATVPGGDSEPGPNMYRDMGTEYLALGLARAGGLGLSRMIAGELSRTKGLGEVIQK